mgnify:CR=1 FL=1
MKRSSGFTMPELVIALVIGAILTSIAFASFRNVQSRFAVRGAKQAYMTLHQRARSMAVERGETVLLVMYTNQDSAALLTRDGASWSWSDHTHFENEFQVDVRTPLNQSYYMCMTPRGYSDYDCGSWGAMSSAFQATFADTFRVQFWQAADSASVLVLPMGQLVGQ